MADELDALLDLADEAIACAMPLDECTQTCTVKAGEPSAAADAEDPLLSLADAVCTVGEQLPSKQAQAGGAGAAGVSLRQNVVKMCDRPAFKPTSSTAASTAARGTASSSALRPGSSDSSKPRPPQQQHQEVQHYVEKLTGLKIKLPRVSGIILRERYRSVTCVTVSKAQSFVAPEGSSWVVIGVLVSKTISNTTKGAPYSRWRVSDLSGSDAHIALFGEAHKEHYAEAEGSVIAFYNPRFSSKGPGGSSSSNGLAVSQAVQVELLATSAGWGFCRGVTKTGGRCSNAVDTTVSPFCQYHALQQAKTLKAPPRLAGRQSQQQQQQQQPPAAAAGSGAGAAAVQPVAGNNGRIFDARSKTWSTASTAAAPPAGAAAVATASKAHGSKAYGGSSSSGQGISGALRGPGGISNGSSSGGGGSSGGGSSSSWGQAGPRGSSGGGSSGGGGGGGALAGASQSRAQQAELRESLKLKLREQQQQQQQLGGDSSGNKPAAAAGGPRCQPVHRSSFSLTAVVSAIGSEAPGPQQGEQHTLHNHHHQQQQQQHNARQQPPGKQSQPKCSKNALNQRQNAVATAATAAAEGNQGDEPVDDELEALFADGDDELLISNKEAAAAEQRMLTQQPEPAAAAAATAAAAMARLSAATKAMLPGTSTSSTSKSTAAQRLRSNLGLGPKAGSVGKKGGGTAAAAESKAGAIGSSHSSKPHVSRIGAVGASTVGGAAAGGAAAVAARPKAGAAPVGAPGTSSGGGGGGAAAAALAARATAAAGTGAGAPGAGGGSRCIQGSASSTAAASGFRAMFGRVLQRSDINVPDAKLLGAASDAAHASMMAKLLDQYEQKDNLAQQLEGITKLEVTAFECRTCKFLTEKRRATCVNHDVVPVRVTKRWWICEACGWKIHTLRELMPSKRCPKCRDPEKLFRPTSAYNVPKPAMADPKSASNPIACREAMLARGVEHAFCLNSLQD